MQTLILLMEECQLVFDDCFDFFFRVLLQVLLGFNGLVLVPKPRVSTPKTLGDAVIKNSHIRLRRGQKMSMLFKMSLPSTTGASVLSP
jgi:hypothetical protein